MGRGHLGGGKTVCRSCCAISSADDGPSESHKKRRSLHGSKTARVRWQKRGLLPKVRTYGGNPPRSARTSRCAKLHEYDRHDPTDLCWGEGTVLAFPWSIQSLSQISCQVQLDHHDGDQPTPAFTLLRSADLDRGPEQILFEKAEAVSPSRNGQRSAKAPLARGERHPRSQTNCAWGRACCLWPLPVPPQ